MDCHILRLLHVDFNPFRLRAWCRRSKQERRWVELSGEMIQIKISRGRRRIKIPYELPLRFEHLKEQMVNYKSTRERVYRLTGPRAVGRAIDRRRKRGVLEQRLKEIIAAVLFAALLLLLT